jgi:vacuolar-type H+-ATPase subunit E/Vma4
VAIDDIVGRIATDAGDESQVLLDAAHADAERARADARARGEALTAREAARGRADAARDAATLLANARLAARDAMLTARQALDSGALASVEAAQVTLDDDRYVALLARGIAAAADGCDGMRLGTADVDRLRRALPAALAAAGVTLPIEDTPADVERGVVLTGDRVRVEVSAAATVAARRDELLAEVDAALFGKGE